MRRFLARLLNLASPGRADREMAREMEAHLALLQEASLAAVRDFGGVDQARELHRDARSFVWMEQRLKDVEHGARGLIRAPSLALVAVVTLALGIGAATSVFSVVNGVLLRPLPYRHRTGSSLSFTTVPARSPLPTTSTGVRPRPPSSRSTSGPRASTCRTRIPSGSGLWSETTVGGSRSSAS